MPKGARWPPPPPPPPIRHFIPSLGHRAPGFNSFFVTAAETLRVASVGASSRSPLVGRIDRSIDPKKAMEWRAARVCVGRGHDGERRDGTMGKKEHGSGEGEGERAAIVSGGCIRRANRGRGRPAIAVVVTGCWPRGFFERSSMGRRLVGSTPFLQLDPTSPHPDRFH